MSDDESFAAVGRARVEHSRTLRLAPARESALTITCGRRVVARVWPRWGSDKMLVTALGSESLRTPWEKLPAQCACDRGAHLLVVSKVEAAVLDRANISASRNPSISVHLLT